MEIKPLKIKEVNEYIRRMFATDPILYNISVEGEISNFKHHYSGHMYFTLKDDESKLNCVMFNGDNKDLDINLENGMHIVASGYISVYKRDGNYQLYVKDVRKKGIGELYKAYEKLKKTLEREGLFEQESKKELPLLPSQIGVVTSATGAAIRDIINVVTRRFPTMNIIIYPVLVQGKKAHEEICKGLKYFDEREDIDLVIVGRGGGSLEELWAFNEEDVARTIYNMSIPVVSAVGHETDFTISDFVADLRAPTPSAAGEISVPVIDQIKEKLDNLLFGLINTQRDYIKNKKNVLEYIRVSRIFTEYKDLINQNRQILDSLYKDLDYNLNTLIKEKNSMINNIDARLKNLDPKGILSRGYIQSLDENGHHIHSIQGLTKDQILNLAFKDGHVKVKIIDINGKG
ncbi:exodeoxyribonuclease VII large subunit [Clostridiisalibacter paucivorans]|uniref:exodeoxyribonuclease VII large subunit n=1 Tax=Clostridiisalibacter paucivorans TaxID=408753 RepID=UPI00047BDF66|nr:exodeoxyribonuclease VII large subunit [Clostridiisalibacter paucivorans]